jgi:hypothetical protein
LVALRFSVLVFALGVAACGARSPLETPELFDEQPPSPTPIENPQPPDPKPVIVTQPPQPDPRPEREPTPAPQPQSVTIGGCPMICEGGCAGPGLVVGTRLDTSQIVIPSDITPEQYPKASGFTCGVDLPVGVDLLLEARVEPGFRFVRWADSVAVSLGWGACPCRDSTDPMCFFSVEKRVYCGAVYTTR